MEGPEESVIDIVAAKIPVPLPKIYPIQEQVMDIHHAMIVRVKPDRLYEALTQPRQLEVWMGAPALARPEVGSSIELQFDQGQRTLKMEITRLEPKRQVQWQVIQPVWPIEAVDQVITWTLIPYESSTLIDFRMEGWPQDDDVYASVSFKWATFMVRLKIYLSDPRDVAAFLSVNRDPKGLQDP